MRVLLKNEQQTHHQGEYEGMNGFKAAQVHGYVGESILF